jgi:DNA polymerase-4
VKGKNPTRRRSILHVDLAPFFVAVERSADPALRGVPVVVGGDADSHGFVAAISQEARNCGVRIGQSLARARKLCPEAIFRPGDLEAYARVSDEVTQVLLAVSRRVERPSADEAFVDLSSTAAPVPAAESIKDALQRLRLDAALGLGASRGVARVASAAARPRGLLIVLPGYEAAFLAGQSLDKVPEIDPDWMSSLRRLGIRTLGDLRGTDAATIASVTGKVAAERILGVVQGTGDGEHSEPSIPITAPPASVQAEQTIRDPHTDEATLSRLVEGLAARALARLRPFRLAAQAIAIEVRHAEGWKRRHTHLQPPVARERALRDIAHSLSSEILSPARGVRGIRVKLSQLTDERAQPTLFPELSPTSGGLAHHP